VSAYTPAWGEPITARAEEIAVEPDQAVTMAYHFLKRGHPFVIDQSSEAHMKDVVVIGKGGRFQTDRAHYDDVRKRATHLDEACQYLTNLVGAGLSFSVTPELIQGDRHEWLFEIRMRRRA
jgi:hypothetical protein